jgi:hypothetical protein
MSKKIIEYSKGNGSILEFGERGIFVTNFALDNSTRQLYTVITYQLILH